MYRATISMCVFDQPSGYAEWLRQGELQPERSRITKADCQRTSGGDGPAALQTRGNA